MKENVCGECRACCQVYDIAFGTTHSLPGNMCPHVCATGCGIYDRRPEVCRRYRCRWHRSEERLPELRPDILGVVVTFNQTMVSSSLPYVTWVLVWEYVVGALETDRVNTYVREQLATPQVNFVMTRRQQDFRFIDIAYYRPGTLNFAVSNAIIRGGHNPQMIEIEVAC